jgi:hypothetical protein
MGETCEEHVKKNDPNIWSCKLINKFFNCHYHIIVALSPVHTRVLFDMLQEAYREKSNRKSLIGSENGQIDFIGLLSAPTTSMPVTSTIVEIETTFITDQSETTEIEHIIPAHNIQIDKVFPDINTASTLDMNTYEFTEQYSQFDNPTTSTPMIIENITTTTIEQIQITSCNITDSQKIINPIDQSNIMITSTPTEWSNDNYIIDSITTQNSIEETNNSPESIIINTMKAIDLPSSNIDMTIDDKKLYLSDRTITSSKQSSSPPDTTAISQTTHSLLLNKLCKKLFSPILPNTSAAPLSPSSKSSSNILLSRLGKHHSSSINTTTTSTVPSLLINQIPTLSVPLKRILLDDVLHQINNYIDDEH